MLRVAVERGAHRAARHLRGRTGEEAGAAHADLPCPARVAATSAVRGIGPWIDAGAATQPRAPAAGREALAQQAGQPAPTGHPAAAAVHRIEPGIHTGAAASEQRAAAERTAAAITARARGAVGVVHARSAIGAGPTRTSAIHVGLTAVDESVDAGGLHLAGRTRAAAVHVGLLAVACSVAARGGHAAVQRAHAARAVGVGEADEARSAAGALSATTVHVALPPVDAPVGAGGPIHLAPTAEQHRHQEARHEATNAESGITGAARAASSTGLSSGGTEVSRR